MSEPARPLPDIAELDTGEFWRRTKNRKLCYQQCASCDGRVFYPRGHCPHCGSGDLAWHQASGNGRIYSFSVIRQSYHPFFLSRVPYAVAWVDLDDGIRILSNVVGIDDPGSDLEIGQKVRVSWEEHDELCIPLFEPC